jgi:hypothetical protein
MVGPYDLSGTLANNHTRSHSVAGRHARHDGSIGNTQVFDSIDGVPAARLQKFTLSHSLNRSLE